MVYLKHRTKLRSITTCSYEGSSTQVPKLQGITGNIFKMSTTTQLADDLFLSEDESSVAGVNEAVDLQAKKKRSKLPTSASTSSKPSRAKKPKINPVSLPDLPTAAELFRSDSEDEEQPRPSSTSPGKKAPILSYISSKIANGYSKQTHPKKTGSHYVEVKVYKCDDLDRVLPVNRWQHAIITVKNQTDVGTEAWTHLNKFINATRKEYNGCPKTFIAKYFY